MLTCDTSMCAAAWLGKQTLGTAPPTDQIHRTNHCPRCERIGTEIVTGLVLGQPYPLRSGLRTQDGANLDAPIGIPMVTGAPGKRLRQFYIRRRASGDLFIVRAVGSHWRSCEMRIGTRVPLGFEAKIRYCDRVLRVPIRDNGRGIDSRVLKEGGIAGIADCGARVNALSALELDLIFGARPEPELRFN